MKNLNLMKRNESGIITKIDESLLREPIFVKGELEAQLLEIGFIEGATVKVLHKGFFGGEPIAFRINNSNTVVALRSLEASIICYE